MLACVSTESDKLSLTIHLPSQESFKAVVIPYIHLIPVVQPRPLQMSVIQLETKGMNEVQTDLRSSTKAGDVASVRGYFRMNKNHVEAGILDNPMLIHDERSSVLALEMVSLLQNGFDFLAPRAILFPPTLTVDERTVDHLSDRVPIPVHS